MIPNLEMLENLGMIGILTLGTTFLNHGDDESSSENQSAVAEPTSFERFLISQSFNMLVQGYKRTSEKEFVITLEMNARFWLIEC